MKTYIGTIIYVQNVQVKAEDTEQAYKLVEAQRFVGLDSYMSNWHIHEVKDND